MRPTDLCHRKNWILGFIIIKEALFATIFILVSYILLNNAYIVLAKIGEFMACACELVFHYTAVKQISNKINSTILKNINGIINGYLQDIFVQLFDVGVFRCDYIL